MCLDNLKINQISYYDLPNSELNLKTFTLTLGIWIIDFYGLKQYRGAMSLRWFSPLH